MHAHDAIEARRSVKKYDATHEMTDEEVDALVRLAMLSPTAFNIQHWRIVRVTDRALRQKIRAVAWDQAQVTDASTLFVLCADVKAWEKHPERYWRRAPEPVRDFMIPAIDSYYRDKDVVQRDECMRSMGIAGQTIMISLPTIHTTRPISSHTTTTTHTPEKCTSHRFRESLHA